MQNHAKSFGNYIKRTILDHLFVHNIFVFLSIVSSELYKLTLWIKMASGGPNVDFWEHFCSFRHHNHQRGFLINDQLAGPSHRSSLSESESDFESKTFYNQPHESIPPTHRESTKTLFRHGCTGTCLIRLIFFC